MIVLCFEKDEILLEKRRGDGGVDVVVLENCYEFKVGG